MLPAIIMTEPLNLKPQLNFVFYKKKKEFLLVLKQVKFLKVNKYYHVEV